MKTNNKQGRNGDKSENLNAILAAFKYSFTGVLKNSITLGSAVIPGGFFTPYTKAGFAWGVVSPIVSPFIFGIIAVGAAAFLTATAIAAVMAIPVFGTAELFGAKSSATTSLLVIALGVCYSIISAALTLMMAAMMVISAPLAFIKLGTRSAATVGAGVNAMMHSIKEFCSTEEAPEMIPFAS